MSKTPRTTRKTETADAASNDAVQTTTTGTHNHDFKDTLDRDAGRVVKRCECGETLVEGDPIA